ncbi:MAG: glycolate oxidase iron-sulfur subunit, partial [Alphaproteobacteria bacterium]
TGDERDSPRGRIWLIRDVMEGAGAPPAEAVFHLDRCLECMACMPACPSGVDYSHLISLAREEIEVRGGHFWGHRFWRAGLAGALTRPGLVRGLFTLARGLRWLMPLLPGRLKGVLGLAGAWTQTGASGPQPDTYPVKGPARGRVGVLAGCVQAGIAPGINQALIRLLGRAGIEVVVLAGAPCCGALDKHLGQGHTARARARAVISAIEQADAAGPLEAVIQTASGCGTMMKDYGYLLGDDPEWAARAMAVAARVRDSSEYLTSLELSFEASLPPLTVVWQAPCSAANAQGLGPEAPALLARAGFTVTEPADSGRCCGSAGAYNILESEMADTLGRLKAEAIERMGADVVASGNIGCMVQLAGRLDVPTLHLVELLDWAAGGPIPHNLKFSASLKTYETGS